MQEEEFCLLAVVADRLDWTEHYSFVAKLKFLRRFGLFIDVGIAVFVVSREIVRRGVAANIAVDAFAIDIKFAGLVVV